MTDIAFVLVAFLGIGVFARKYNTRTRLLLGLIIVVLLILTYRY